ncbi:hypothetical protein AMJ83_09280 [candidate division WOR_3 bacterium SM23_42]|uniref:HEAT repeat domain-containing protein n=1 Tax=candidate division WOR_3 bacterium SM23_42 TaxID=1703779 RepID=A0A0S8FS95_UNCW3|nr:MAG: hypothetical protein AMJ83_09280 [candidate division WOR_3 bacterium SM23_42]
MDQLLVMELIKELAVGFKAARSYPTGHPVFDRAVSRAMSVLTRICAEHSKFSITLAEDGVVCQDVRLEIGKNPALISLVDNLRRKDITSISFTSAVKHDDIAHLYSVLASLQAQLGEHGDAAKMLKAQGTESIMINRTPAASVMKKDTSTKTHEEIIEAIRTLMEIVRRHGAVSESRGPFAIVLNDIEEVSKGDWHSYSEALSGVVDLLPLEKRVALLQDVQMKSFVLTLMSRLKAETLVELITNWERQGRKDCITKVMGVIEKEKFTEMVPNLKKKQINIYEYLTNASINILDDDVAAALTEEDIKVLVQPYYNALETHDAGLRVEALKSLIKLARRLVVDKKFDMATPIILRISVAIEQEAVDEAISQVMKDLQDLYAALTKHEQRDLCEKLVEPFGNISGRAGLSLDLRREIVKFLSATGNPSVLPMLFSFLWESGLYPEVRSAIQGFGRHAVNQAIQFLRDAEDFSVRMKLVDVLKNIGEPSIEVLRINLDAREWYLRRNIVRIFGEIGDPGVVTHLERMLRDEDQRVRLELVRTWGKLNYRDGLVKALNDKSVQVKGEALRGLRKFLDAEEVIDLLPGLSETGDEVYVELLKIIDEKKVFEAMNWIGDLLKRLEWRDDAPAKEIKELGVSALTKLDGDNAKMILLDLQKSKDKTLANFAAAALRRIG